MDAWTCSRCGPLAPTKYREYLYVTGRVRRCIECSTKKRASFYEENKTHENAVSKAKRHALRLEVISAYSVDRACELCSERHVEFLVVDHIEGGGNQHRKEVGRSSFYRWLKKNEYPSGFRILCYNCNWKCGARAKTGVGFSESSNRHTILKQAYRIKHPDKYSEYKETLRSAAQKERERITSHYGNKCACCEIGDMDVLSLDHVEGGGTRHRKEIGSGPKFFKWVESAGFPPLFQTLCLNCNIAKGLYGRCPHGSDENLNLATHNRALNV